MRTSIILALPVASALLVTLSFPSFDVGVLAWFALAPLLFALRQGRVPLAAAVGFLFGILQAGGVFYWLGGIASMTPATTLLLYVSFGAYYLLFGALYRLVSTATGSWIILAAPALWVALEYVRANLSFLAFPWNLVGHSQYRYLAVIQIADLTGVFGISFLVVMANQLASQAPDVFATRATSGALPGGRVNWPAHLLTVVTLVMLTLGYGWWRLAAPQGGERVRVALVQANVLARPNMSLAEQAEHLRAYELLTREASKSGPDLIVWPSSSLPAPFRFRLVSLYVTRLARETGTYLLVGGAGGDKLAPARDGQRPYSNSEFLISPSGVLEGQYNKVRLTPFNEYVPLKAIPWPRWIITLKDSFVPGTEYRLFQLSRARFGAPICWENTFPDLFRRFVREGARFMVSVTNEGFFGSTSAPHQTLAMNVFRAVENRVAVVRSATTGVSAFIDPTGGIVARVSNADGKDLFVAGFLVRDVPLSTRTTLYTEYGDVFAYAVMGIAALPLLTCLLGPRSVHLYRRFVKSTRERGSSPVLD